MGSRKFPNRSKNMKTSFGWTDFSFRKTRASLNPASPGFEPNTFSTCH